MAYKQRDKLRYSRYRGGSNVQKMEEDVEEWALAEETRMNKYT